MSRLTRRQSAAVQAPSIQTYKCQECNMSFLFPSLVRRCMLTHIGERPYTCDNCSEEFTQVCNLKRHVGTHKGERLYPCATCSNRFSVQPQEAPADQARRTRARPPCRQSEHAFKSSHVCVNVCVCVGMTELSTMVNSDVRRCSHVTRRLRQPHLPRRLAVAHVCRREIARHICVYSPPD